VDAAEFDFWGKDSANIEPTSKKTIGALDALALMGITELEEKANRSPGRKRRK
jgi:hypothetical protein